MSFIIWKDFLTNPCWLPEIIRSKSFPQGEETLISCHFGNDVHSPFVLWLPINNFHVLNSEIRSKCWGLFCDSPPLFMDSTWFWQCPLAWKLQWWPGPKSCWQGNVRRCLLARILELDYKKKIVARVDANHGWDVGLLKNIVIYNCVAKSEI